VAGNGARRPRQGTNISALELLPEFQWVLVGTEEGGLIITETALDV